MRTTELRAAQWTEINFEAGGMAHTSRMHEMGRLHIVPLSRQVILALEELKKLNSNSPFLFPNQANPQKCMSENTILYALYRMGYHSRAMWHGFIRSTASTILNEKGFSL